MPEIQQFRVFCPQNSFIWGVFAMTVVLTCLAVIWPSQHSKWMTMWPQRGLVRGTSPHLTAQAPSFQLLSYAGRIWRWSSVFIVKESTGVNLEMLMFSPPIVEFALEILAWIHLCLMYSLCVYMPIFRAHMFLCAYVCHLLEGSQIE